MVSTRLTEGTLELRYTPIDPYGAVGMTNCEKAETHECEVCHHQATSEGCPNCLSEEVARLRIVLRTARSLGTLFEVQTFIDAELDED